MYIDLRLFVDDRKDKTSPMEVTINMDANIMEVCSSLAVLCRNILSQSGHTDFNLLKLFLDLDEPNFDDYKAVQIMGLN
jgi:hypothetical protein